MKYLVTFKYTSFYEDEKENKIAKVGSLLKCIFTRDLDSINRTK